MIERLLREYRIEYKIWEYWSSLKVACWLWCEPLIELIWRHSASLCSFLLKCEASSSFALERSWYKLEKQGKVDYVTSKAWVFFNGPGVKI